MLFISVVHFLSANLVGHPVGSFSSDLGFRGFLLWEVFFLLDSLWGFGMPLAHASSVTCFISWVVSDFVSVGFLLP